MATSLVNRYLPKMVIGGTAILCVVLMLSEVNIEYGSGDDPTSIPFLSYNNKSKKDRRTFDFLNQERRTAAKRLSDMDLVNQANSDVLPIRSSNATAKQMCEGNNHTFCSPKFLQLETRIRVAPAHKMLNCIVQKSMSTVMTAIMCFLFEEEAFRNANRGFFMEWSTYRFCKNKNEYSSVTAARMDNKIPRNLAGWSFSMVTRDPVERFISGYVDKCIRKPIGAVPCNGCGHNMTCFIITEYERIKKQTQEHKLTRSFEDRHFYPQAWRCGLRKEYKNYEFLRYSSDPNDSFQADLFKIARKQNVSEESINFIKAQLAQGRTVHSTVESPARSFLEKRLRQSPFLMEYIVKMFYHDFLLFKYDFPSGF